MKRQRTYNLISLIMNLLIVFFTIIAVAYNFKTDIIRDEIWFGYTGFNSLVFFTTLSNILVAISSLVILKYNFKNVVNDKYEFSKGAVIFKFMGTVSVAITFLTVVFFLAPVATGNGYSYFYLFNKNNLYLHLLTPVLAIVSFLLFEYHQDFKFKQVILGVVPVFIYSIVYLIMVVIIGKDNGGWEDFYGFTFGGKNYLVPFTMIAMYAFGYGISVGIHFLQRKISKK